MVRYHANVKNANIKCILLHVAAVGRAQILELNDAH